MNRVTTALLLAAGSGIRLQPLTNSAPKCLTEVHGVALLERLVCSLREFGFKRLVVVVGHLDQCVRDALSSWTGDMAIEYVVNARYQTTNNLYSLWLARRTIREPLLLLECDLIFDPSVIVKMLHPDRIAVSPMRPWMKGTTVTVNSLGNVTAFRVDSLADRGDFAFKTVNMYSFSIRTWQEITQRLGRHVSESRLDQFYETVFAEMVAEGRLSLRAVMLDPDSWYEIDTLEDLHQAEMTFSSDSWSITG